MNNLCFVRITERRRPTAGRLWSYGNEMRTHTLRPLARIALFTPEIFRPNTVAIEINITNLNSKVEKIRKNFITNFDQLIAWFLATP